jgi:hypothetical protein
MEPTINEQALLILIAYGFSEKISLAALKAVGGSSIDAALDWIQENKD